MPGLASLSTLAGISGVQIGPGALAFSRILRLSQSWPAKLRVEVGTALLVVQESTSRPLPFYAMMEVV